KFRRNKESAFDEIKDKRKKDFIAQLAKENNIKNTEYSGIDKFIELSQGNVRHFILILKKAIENSRIRGERPLEDGGRISLDAQYLAVYDTAKWFYEDIEVVGEQGKEMYSSLKNLTDYFIQERFCDKPVETTVSCFYVKADELSGKALKCLDLLKMHSVLIEDEEGRYDRNTGRKERLFQLNKILAPLWNLPTVVRGSISLNNEIAEAILNHDQNSRFQKLYKLRKNQLNAPEFLKIKSQDTQTLF
ncbi:ORC-CDC6 family AAA ATPase, partial [Sphingobacterium multivorum]|uniref:ORC-CDC6 family AAA ATPase n=3 Tax=Sphingobacteriaceae TaxID=84566 RepID=UPI0028B124D2